VGYRRFQIGCVLVEYDLFITQLLHKIHIYKFDMDNAFNGTVVNQTSLPEGHLILHLQFLI